MEYNQIQKRFNKCTTYEEFIHERQNMLVEWHQNIIQKVGGQDEFNKYTLSFMNRGKETPYQKMNTKLWSLMKVFYTETKYKEYKQND